MELKHPEKARLAREAKAIVALAFRNGPIENLHAGEICPHCHDEISYSHISDVEMKVIMKAAVDMVFDLLVLRDHDEAGFERQVVFGERYTDAWDSPKTLQAHGT